MSRRKSVVDNGAVGDGITDDSAAFETQASDLFTLEARGERRVAIVQDGEDVATFLPEDELTIHEGENATTGAPQVTVHVGPDKDGEGYVFAGSEADFRSTVERLADA